MNRSITQCLLFPDAFPKPVVARFDQELGSSDGGAVLLKAADRQLGVTKALAGSLRDKRDPDRVVHDLEDLVAQRVFTLACGYPDANDAARLADDPVHKLLLDRDPIEGEPLASQPTLSRFENAAGPRALYRMADRLADLVIARHRRRLRGKVRRITIDLDPTDDPTHGQQQLALFNGHFGCWCYLPMLAFLRFNDEPESFLVAAMLRPGNAPTKKGTLAILWRLLEWLTVAFPGARIVVRLDAGFASPEILDFLDEAGVEYVVAMGKNAVLERAAEPLLKQARRASAQSGQSEKRYGECRYAAKSWSRERRVIFKAEVTRFPGREPKDNPRFVVTNLRTPPRSVYERTYCPRGDTENRIKELFYGLDIGRTSCSRFWANQFRVLLTQAAYVLLQELRLQLRGTALARAQVATMRDHLLKLGVQVTVSVRRIVLHLARSYPFRAAWCRAAMGLGARAG